jgi:hypothetical protein
MSGKNTGEDKFGGDRVTKGGSAAHSPRDSADVGRKNEDGGYLAAEERRRLLRNEAVAEILPTPPKIDGYHFCWLSTTNSNDPIHRRMSVGYLPVKASELNGFDQYKIADGSQFEGCIACNEMLLFKIEEVRYQDLMMIYHHDIPLEQEQSIRDKVVNAAKNERDSDDRQIGIVEGEFENLGRQVRTPHFAS